MFESLLIHLRNRAPELIAGGALFLVSLFAGLVLTTWILRRLPVDYFTESHRISSFDVSSPRAVALRLLRNLAGALLLLVGFALLFLPGQGLLTMLAGLLLLDFPAKRLFVLWLVRSPSARSALNWFRHKLQRPPFRFSEK